MNLLRDTAIIQEKKDRVFVINKSKVHHKMIHDANQPWLLCKSLYPLKQCFVDKTMTNNSLQKPYMISKIRIQVWNYSRQGYNVFKKKSIYALTKDQVASPSKIILFWVQYKMYAFIKKWIWSKDYLALYIWLLNRKDDWGSQRAFITRQRYPMLLCHGTSVSNPFI